MYVYIHANIYPSFIIIAIIIIFEAIKYDTQLTTLGI
jgi:hypothetical protein